VISPRERHSPRSAACAVDVPFKATRSGSCAGEQEELDRLAAELDDPSEIAITVGIRPDVYPYPLVEPSTK
jgi:hypothetical protein